MTERQTAPDSAAETVGATFDVVLRGYDRRQVNEYVSALAERVERESSALRAAERELGELRDRDFGRQASSEQSADATGTDGLGAVVESIVANAESEVRARLTDAESAAALVLAGAEREAAEIIAAARHTADGITEDARRLRADARDNTDSTATVEQQRRHALRTHESVLADLAHIRQLIDSVGPLLDGQTDTNDAGGAQVPAARRSPDRNTRRAAVRAEGPPSEGPPAEATTTTSDTTSTGGGARSGASRRGGTQRRR